MNSSSGTPGKKKIYAELALRLTANQLFNLLLRRTTRFGALCLRSGLLAGGPLQLLPFQLVFNIGGICHV